LSCTSLERSEKRFPLHRIQQSYLPWLGNAIRIVVCLLLIPDSPEAASYPQSRHNAEVEIWSLLGRYSTPSQDTSYFGVIFVSGRKLFVRGNFIQFISYNPKENNYVQRLASDFSLRRKHTESVEVLNEVFGDAYLGYNDSLDYFDIKPAFDIFPYSLHVWPVKDPVPFASIFTKKWEDSRFNWYLYPRMRIDLFPTDSGKGQLGGEAHLQHFWGSPSGKNNDFFVIHLESGFDIIAGVLPKNTVSPDWLPDSYVCIVYPEGRRALMPSFDYSVTQWYRHDDSGLDYPVSATLSAPDENINLTVSAFDEQQFLSMRGRENWSGFGRVAGMVKGKPDTGWCYLSPMGRKRGD